MTRVFLIWLLVVMGLAGRSQSDLDLSGGPDSSFEVSGLVTDSTATPLGGATIQLACRGDTLATVTSSRGTYHFPQVRARRFRLTVTMKGYVPLTVTLGVQPARGLLQIPTIILRVNYEDLEPVIVSHIRPVSISGDTVSYNASSFPVREGSEVEDILRRLPGIEVDLDGDIIVQGRKISKVTVNGKDFFGGDVLLAIRNLPADIVLKLQIIDDYGDKARLTGIKVEDPAKVLNIVLQPNKQSGLFGHIQVGAGNDSKYAEQVFANAFDGGRQISFKADAGDENLSARNPNEHIALIYAGAWRPRWRVALNAGGDLDELYTSSTMIQNNYYPDDQSNLQQSISSDSYRKSYNIGSTFNFDPNPSSALRFSPVFDGHSGSSRSKTDFTLLETDSAFTKTMSGMTSSSTISKGWHAGNELYYKQKMPQNNQQFIVAAAVSYTQDQGRSDNMSTGTGITNSVPGQSSLHYLNFNFSGNLTLDLRTNYYYPVGAGKLIEVGYFAQSSRSRMVEVAQTPDSLTAVPMTIDSLSLKEPYFIAKQRLHGGYEATYAKLTLAVIMEGEWGHLSGVADNKGDKYGYSYFAPLPSIRINWKLSSKHAFSFQYTVSGIIPSVQQTMPIRNTSNPQYPVIGNPGLKPTYPQAAVIGYENIDFHDGKFFGFGLSLAISAVTDPIVAAITHPRDSVQVIQSTTYLNTGRTLSYSGSYHFTLPAFFGGLFRVTGNGSLIDTESPGLTDGNDYTVRNLSCYQALHFQVSIPDKIDLDLQGDYSITHSAFFSSSQLPLTVQTGNLQFGGRKILFLHWKFGCRIDQLYVYTTSGMHPSPATLTALVQREVLRHGRGNISISGYNLLNSVAGSSLTVTSISTTETQTNFVGRFFLLKFALKLDRFN